MTEVLNPEQPRPVGSTAGEKIRHEESAPLAPFTVSLSATGDFKPGQPVRIHAVVQGLMDTRDVEIQIVAPDVAAARAGEWREMVRDQGVPTPPEASWHASMTAGSRFEREISLMILRPGYYFVLLAAFRKSGEGPLLSGRLVSDQAHAGAWLWIAESGGRTTPKFDLRIIPEGFQTQPGILCAQRDLSCSRSSRSGLRTTVQTAARLAMNGDVPPFLPVPPPFSTPIPQGSCNNFRFVVNYYNKSSNSYQPLAEAYVYVDGYFDNGNYAYGQYGYTDANGVTGYFWCIPGQSGTYIAQVWTYREGKLQVTPRSAVAQISGSMDDAASIGEMPIWMDDCDRCHVFKNSILTFNESVNRFGRSRVTVAQFRGPVIS